MYIAVRLIKCAQPHLLMAIESSIELYSLSRPSRQTADLYACARHVLFAWKHTEHSMPGQEQVQGKERKRERRINSLSLARDASLVSFFHGSGCPNQVPTSADVLTGQCTFAHFAGLRLPFSQLLPRICIVYIDPVKTFSS
jgi:hypothetical protein